MVRVELTRVLPHRDLNPARLPVPPHPHTGEMARIIRLRSGMSKLFIKNSLDKSLHEERILVRRSGSGLAYRVA